MLYLWQEDLPETVRQTKERMLKSLQQDLTDKAMEKKSKKMEKKYRMVKFFGEYTCIIIRSLAHQTPKEGKEEREVW